MRPDQPTWYGMGGFAVRPTRPNVSEVLPVLLVGEYPNVEDLVWLRDVHGVTAIVNLQDEADLASKRLRLDDLVRTAAAHDLTFDHLPVTDGDVLMLAARLPAIVAQIHVRLGQGARVYLHCNGGMNRAPTAAMAYVHVHHGLALDAAVTFVQARRPSAPYVRALRACYEPSGA